MGRDFEIVAYRGTLLSDAELGRIVRRTVPSFELYRHSPGPLAWSRFKVAPLDNLHCIAMYEKVSRPSKLFYSESTFAPLQQQAAQPDRSLASVVQQAWAKMRADIMRAPRRDVDTTDDDAGDETHREPTALAHDDSDDETDRESAAAREDADHHETLELARALALVAGEAFWLSRGDHSCIGGFAHFKGDKLVGRASADDIWTADADDYVAIPDHKWSAALGVAVTLDDVVKKYFPDRKTPPLLDKTEPSRPIPFDGQTYDFALD